MNKDNIKIFQEMLFIYNAILNGWTVSKINNKKYRFRRKKNSISYNLERINLKEFIKNNSSLSLFY